MYKQSFTLTALLVAALVLSACAGFEQPEIVVEPATSDDQMNSQANLPLPGVGDAANVLITASSLSDYNFENIDGEVSGSIENVIVDLSSGNIPYVTVEYGGFLDIGDTELPMPLSAFVWGPNGELVLNFDEALLNEFPDLGTNWPDLSTADWDNDVVDFWRGINIDPGIDFTAVTDSVVRVDEIIGFNIGDIGLGASDVNDMLIDLGESRVKYVVVEYDTGIFNDELVAVPFDAFEAASFGTGTEFTMAPEIDSTVLESAPRFSRDVFRTGDAQVFTDINNYWGGLGFGGSLFDSEIEPRANVTEENAGQMAMTGQMGVSGTEEVLVRASDLLDYDVRNLAGDNIGEIEDVILDTETGRVLFATLEYGGFLDLGDSEVPVPLSAFSWANEYELTLNIDEQQLDALPDLDSNWVNAADVTWNDDVVNFWNNAGVNPGYGAMDSQTVMYLSEFMDYEMNDFGIGSEGEIHDLLINLNSSQALWAIVDYGGLFNDELIPVPFSAVDVNMNGDAFDFTPNMDPVLLETAPRIDRVSFDEAGLIDENFDDDIATYWEDSGYEIESSESF